MQLYVLWAHCLPIHHNHVLTLTKIRVYANEILASFCSWIAECNQTWLARSPHFIETFIFMCWPILLICTPMHTSKWQACTPNLPPKLLNPKQRKAKLLGWAFLSQNPMTMTMNMIWRVPPVSHLLPRPTEKNQLLGPHKRYWSEILRLSSNSLNLIFGLVLINPIGSSN